MKGLIFPRKEVKIITRKIVVLMALVVVLAPSLAEAEGLPVYWNPSYWASVISYAAIPTIMPSYVSIVASYFSSATVNEYPPIYARGTKTFIGVNSIGVYSWAYVVVGWDRSLPPMYNAGGGFTSRLPCGQILLGPGVTIPITR